MKKTFLLALMVALLGLLPAFGTVPAVKPGQPPTGDGSPGMSASVATSQMADIHDIQPPIAPGLNPWLQVGLPAALLAIILAALWLYLQRKQSTATESVIQGEPPHTVALNALEDLAQHNDLDARRFYFRLSAIVRRYIQERFAIDALEMTIEQLQPAIGALDLDDTLQQKLKQCLGDAEPIKFAGRPADRSRMKSDMAFAIEFVKQTTPVEYK